MARWYLYQYERGGTLYTENAPTQADEQRNFVRGGGITFHTSSRNFGTNASRTVTPSASQPNAGYRLVLAFDEIGHAQTTFANGQDVVGITVNVAYSIGNDRFTQRLRDAAFVRVSDTTYVSTATYEARAGFTVTSATATIRDTGVARKTPLNAASVSRSVETNSDALTYSIATVFINETATTKYAINSSSIGIATVARAGDTITVTPGSTAGTARIRVFAWDVGQDDKTWILDLTTTAPVTTNPAPTAVGTMPNITAQVSTAAQRVAVSSYFSDTDTLTYSAVSSNTGVATVSVSGSTLTVSPGSTAGTSTITVTATDTASQTITQTFTVTTTAAPPVNPAPTRVGTIAGRTAQTGSAAATLNVAPFFTDTDTLTYSAVSATTSVVTVSMSGSVLTMTPGSTAGSSTITVTATDTASQSITQTFTFTTQTAPITNPAPTRVGTIPAATYQVGTGPHNIAAASYFSDTDTLTYGITSSHSTIASATINETTGAAAITAVAAGTATITIVATDTANQTATQAFIVTVSAVDVPDEGPTVVYASIAAQIPDQTIETDGHLELDMSPYFNDAEAWLATSRNATIVEAEGDSRIGGIVLIGSGFDANTGTAEIVVNAVNWASVFDAINRGLPETAPYATQTFNVTVVSPSSVKPIVTRQASDFAGYLRSDDPPIVIDNPRKFFQWTGQGTISATSSNTDIATVAYDATANTLTITPVKGGWVEIAITLTYPLAPSGGIGAAGQQSPTMGTEEIAFSLLAADPPEARQAYREPFLICVDIGGDVDLHVCSYNENITIGGQEYIGMGRFMGLMPLSATGQRDNRSGMEVRMVVDDTVTGLADAINAVGGPPVTISIYNEKGDPVPIPPTGVPGAPSGLQTSALAYNSITYAWGGVNDATGYDLYISRFPTAPRVDTVPTVSIGNLLTYQLTRFPDGTTVRWNTGYFAWVRARNSRGAGAWSPVFTVTTPQHPPPPAPARVWDTGTNLRWDAVEGADGYEISYTTTSAAAGSVRARVVGGSTTTLYILPARTWPFRGYYWVRSYSDDYGSGPWSAPHFRDS